MNSVSGIVWLGIGVAVGWLLWGRMTTSAAPVVAPPSPTTGVNIPGLPQTSYGGLPPMCGGSQCGH
jgi:hypothetical protein